MPTGSAWAPGTTIKGWCSHTMYGELNRTSTLLYALRKYAPELHTHQLRHFFGTQLMEAGVALPRVSALMGHSSIAVTAGIYLHPDATGDRAAVELLAGRVAGVKWRRNGGGGR